MRAREPQNLLAAVHRGRVTSPVRHEQATTSTRTWRALPIHETCANTGQLARASRGRLRWTRRSGTSRLLDVADEGALSSTHAPQSHAVTRAAIATPLHPPPASGSVSSLAKEHVAEEHVRVGVAERCSAACAGARPASGSVVGPLGPARRRVTQVRISSSERLLHLRSGARRDARALAPDQSTRMVYNTTKFVPDPTGTGR